MNSSRFLGAILFAAGLSASCVVVPPRDVAFVRVRPPRAIVELRSSAPGPGHIWIGGYYRWDDGAYHWVPGHWERVPEGRRHWVPGRWRSYHGQWYWVEGHWR